MVEEQKPTRKRKHNQRIQTTIQSCPNPKYQPKKLANNLITILNKIIEDPTSKNIEPPVIPKSRARDMNGFSQRELIQLIRGNNLNETAIRAKYVIEKAISNPTGNLLIHSTSKILLKQKKEIIESSKDLRPISIMPTIIMACDKIANCYLKSYIEKLTFRKQHRARRGTSTAKLNII